MNVEKYKRVLEQIEAHPETWDQNVWHAACGTVHCFAGWAQFLEHREVCDSYRTSSDAIKALEINTDQASWLFAANRTIEDFRDFLEQHKGDPA